MPSLLHMLDIDSCMYVEADRNVCTFAHKGNHIVDRTGTEISPNLVQFQFGCKSADHNGKGCKL